MKIAAEIMSREVKTVTSDLSIQELAQRFSEERVSGFPVVDDGELVGVVTETDLIHQNERLHIPTMFAIFDAVIMLGDSRRTEEELQRMSASTVGEIMKKPAITIGMEATLADIASLMGDRDIHTLPVVDDEGALVGVVGKLDLIRAMGRG